MRVIDTKSVRGERNEFSISSRAHRRFTTQRLYYAIHSRCDGGEFTNVQIVLGAKCARISRSAFYCIIAQSAPRILGCGLIWQMSDSRILLSTFIQSTYTNTHTYKLGGKWILPGYGWIDMIGRRGVFGVLQCVNCRIAKRAAERIIRATTEQNTRPRFDC